NTPPRGRVVRPAGIVALLRSANQSIGRPIGRFVTQIDLGDRSDIITCVIDFCRAAIHRGLSICSAHYGWKSVRL
ncbi:hypothetical protein ALC60_12933, partial [Trachymyrmex zeteki]